MDPEDLLRERSVQPKDQKIDIEIKKQEDFKDPLVRREKKETMAEFRVRITVQQEQKLDKRFSIPGRIRDRAPI